jgi:hypothetical protein
VLKNHRQETGWKRGKVLSLDTAKITKLSVTPINIVLPKKKKQKKAHQHLLVPFILLLTRLRYKRLMQYDAKVEIKVGGDLIPAMTRCCRIGGYRVCHKSKGIFRNIANITREYVRNITELVGNFKLMLCPIVERNCTICER